MVYQHYGQRCRRLRVGEHHPATPVLPATTPAELSDAQGPELLPDHLLPTRHHIRPRAFQPVSACLRLCWRHGGDVAAGEQSGSEARVRREADDSPGEEVVDGAASATMNLVLLRDTDSWLADGVVRLGDHRADHILGQLGAVVGDTVKVGVLAGQVGLAVVVAIDQGTVSLAVDLLRSPPPRHSFDLVLALPRPKMLRRILRTVAEFGVQNLHLINSARVEKSYWQTPLLEPAKVEEALIAGMERASDTVFPQVHLHKRFRPFVEDQLTSLCAGRPCWIADMEAPVGLAEQPPAPAVVMIGPEGGFVPFELDLAESVVARRVHLGVRTFSVDTALTTVLAQVLPGTAECEGMGLNAQTPQGS